jgi:hypothetical protein
MFRKLAVLVSVNFAAVVAFILTYLKHQTLVPLYVGFLPFVLCNFIYVREFLRPVVKVESLPPAGKSSKRISAFSLFIMPVGFCFTLPALVEFDSSLGWSPVVCLGFSVLLCIVIISLYGSVKIILRKE